MFEDAIRKYGFIVLLGALFFQMVFSEGGVFGYIMLRKDMRATDVSIASLEKENKTLTAEIDKLQKDDQYLEEMVRTKYGLVRDGEKVYRVEK